MDQSRKSSEKEKVALQQAQEAIAAKEAAVSEAAKATTRENFMLELMTEASLDMTGMLCKPKLPLFFPCFLL
jgi:regulator of protease activity HflC (stomatin/prohibitin superfamily)